MNSRILTVRSSAVALVAACLLVAATPAMGQLNLGPGQLVQSAGLDITVPGYSVPSFVDWNDDGLMDLIVGEGSGGSPSAKVGVYLNTGTAGAPQFSGSFYAQSVGSDLIETGSGCMGLFPRTVYWDGDGMKDLLVGRADGMIKLYGNIGTEAAPTFDAGVFLQVGEPGSKVDIDIGYRATASMVDWNNDGRKDLVSGGLSGNIQVFLNEGTDAAPDFLTSFFAQAGGSDLVVPSIRSSPVILDLDGDGRKDLLTGNTNGELLFYANTGTDADPSFDDFVYVESEGVPIDHAGTPRSRPFITDWTGDGYLDVLYGAGCGEVHLYQGVPEPATLCLLGVGLAVVIRKRR